VKVLDLFSGIGGFSLGLERAGMETVAFCEIDEWCQENALKLNWPNVEIYNDIRKINSEQFIEKHGRVDVVTSGTPCQPASIIGKRKGAEDSRWLWPDTLRIVEQLKPRWFVGENPTGLLTLDGGDRFGEIIERLSKAGYDCIWETIPASAVGGGHRRERVWIIAHASGERLERHTGYGDNINEPGRFKACTSGPTSQKTVFPVRDSERWWEDKSPVPIVVDGVSDPSFWKQAVIATGNAVVPQIPEMIGRAIMEIENNNEQL